LRCGRLGHVDPTEMFKVGRRIPVRLRWRYGRTDVGALDPPTRAVRDRDRPCH
jgi:hypothetical protein